MFLRVIHHPCVLLLVSLTPLFPLTVSVGTIGSDRNNGLRKGGINTSLLSKAQQQLGGVSPLDFFNGISCEPILRQWSFRFTRQL